MSKATVYQHQDYPKTVFHPELAPEGKVVPTVDAHQALGDGWVESPADFPGATEAKPANTPLDEQATELHNTPAKDVIKSIADVADVTMLARIKGFEEANPKGARASVLKAIAARAEVLVTA